MSEKAPYAHYDPEADALWLQLADGQAEDTEEVGDNVMVSYDKDGTPVAVEMIGGVKEAFADLIAKAGGIPQKTGRSS